MHTKRGFLVAPFCFCIQNSRHRADAGTLLMLAFLVRWQNRDIDFVFDDRAQVFIAVRTVHRKRGLGVEAGIFEDDLCARRAIACVGFFLQIHILVSRGSLLPTRLANEKSGFRSGWQ